MISPLLDQLLLKLAAALTSAQSSEAPAGVRYWAVKVDTDHLQELAQDVMVSELRAPATAFAQNIDSTSGALILPRLLMAYAFDPAAFSQDPVTHWSRLRISWSLTKALVLAERVQKLERGERFLRALMLQCAAAAWTAFETVAEDTYEAASGCAGSMQRVRASGNLGRLKDAYANLLGETHAVVAIFDLVDLRRLQQLRHIIVHRGGSVDREYASRIGLDDALIGTSVPIDSQTVSLHIQTAADAGEKLLRAVNEWLVTLKSSNAME